MRVEELVSPRSTSEVFESDEDSMLLRPFMTGDIFVGVADPDADEDAEVQAMTVAVVAHPCVMRGSGGQLVTRVPCCLVSQISAEVPFSAWPDGHFDYLPLPDELGLGERQAVRLAEFRPVHKRELQRARRRVALTPRGVYVFQQRFTHSLTRVAFDVDAFKEGAAHVVTEAELETEWVEQFADLESSESDIRKVVKAFHRMLDEDHDGRPLRDALRELGGDSHVRRVVRRRMAEAPPS